LWRDIDSASTGEKGGHLEISLLENSEVDIDWLGRVACFANLLRARDAGCSGPLCSSLRLYCNNIALITRLGSSRAGDV
jgi:hypothetical protein